MATVPAFEAKTNFGELLDRVVEGEEIVITRHERPVARLVAEGGRNLADIRRAAEGLEALQKEIAESSKGRFLSWKDFCRLLRKDAFEPLETSRSKQRRKNHVSSFCKLTL